MNVPKPEARNTHWCGVLNNESMAAAPAARTRTVRGPYSTFTASPQKTDRSNMPEAMAPDLGAAARNRKA